MENKWIPVSERKPDIDEKVDWISPDGDVVIGGIRGMCGWYEAGNCFPYTPIFWRPSEIKCGDEKMHTTTKGDIFCFTHNKDFSGNIRIKKKECFSGTEISVPFSEILMLVAKWKKIKMIHEIENMADVEFLMKR